MNEVDLIKEVEKRPILYDKSTNGFNKSRLRDDAWKEVHETLNVTEAECKKRWRSLRDSFIKLQRTRGGRTRWPYHMSMRFLLPHLEFKVNVPTLDLPGGSMQNDHTTGKKEHDDSDAEEEVRQRAIQALPDLPNFNTPETSTDKIIIYTNSTPKYQEEDNFQPPKKSRQVSSSDDDSQDASPGHICTRSDPDELFLLSCAPSLKRLNPRQNALARLKIQQVLLEAEFGSRMEMPYVAPASDCSFDPI